MPMIFRRLLVVLALAGTSVQAQAARSPLRCSSVADYVELQGRDTVAFNRLAFTDSSFDSNTRSVSMGALVRHTGHLTASGELSQLHLEVWPNIADSAAAPGQIADVMVQGSDVNARVAAPSRGVQMQRDLLPTGGVLYMTGIPVFLELIQRRANVAVGATARVPALWLFTRGHVDTVQVSRPAADSVVMRFPAYEYNLKLAPDRSILSMTGAPKAEPSGPASRLVRRDCR